MPAPAFCGWVLGLQVSAFLMVALCGLLERSEDHF